MTKLKKKESYSGNDLKRYVGALQEHFTDGLKAIGEQYFGIQTRLDSHENKLDSHTGMIGQIMIQLEEIKGELKQKVSYQDFTKLERRVAVLETQH